MLPRFSTVVLSLTTMTHWTSCSRTPYWWTPQKWWRPQPARGCSSGTGPASPSPGGPAPRRGSSPRRPRRTRPREKTGELEKHPKYLFHFTFSLLLLSMLERPDRSELPGCDKWNTSGKTNVWHHLISYLMRMIFELILFNINVQKLLISLNIF